VGGATRWSLVVHGGGPGRLDLSLGGNGISSYLGESISVSVNAAGVSRIASATTHSRGEASPPNRLHAVDPAGELDREFNSSGSDRGRLDITEVEAVHGCEGPGLLLIAAYRHFDDAVFIDWSASWCRITW
jgi:hypothetical protein